MHINPHPGQPPQQLSIVWRSNSQRSFDIKPLPLLSLQLITASAQGDTEGVALAVASGADTEQSLVGGVTALMMACCNGHDKVIPILAPACDVLATDAQGCNALHKAAGYGHAHCAEALLALPQAQALSQAKDNQGQTPFLLSAARGDPYCLKALLADSDPDLIDSKGRDALMIAAEFGMCESVEILLQHGFNPSATARDGSNAFMLASSGAWLDSMRILAPLCDTLATDAQERTALIHFALGATPPYFSSSWVRQILLDTQIREADACDYLLQIGIAPDHRDTAGFNALDYSCSLGNEHVARRLFFSMPRDQHLPIAASASKHARAANFHALADSLSAWSLAISEYATLDLSTPTNIATTSRRKIL